MEEARPPCPNQTLCALLPEHVGPCLIMASETEARYRTSEMEPGETCSLAEMLEANAEDSWVCEAILRLQPGESWHDIVTVERLV